MDEYKEQLRRLAIHDDALLEALAVEGGSFAASVIDAKTAALVPGVLPARHNACARRRRE